MVSTLAALIGAGGLGDPIFRGISSVNNQMILPGAVPAAVLAVVVDRALHWLETRQGAPAVEAALSVSASHVFCVTNKSYFPTLHQIRN